MTKGSVSEIAELLCLGIMMKESKTPSSKKLALLCIDKAATAALRLYAFNHKSEIGNSEIFSSVLSYAKDRNSMIPIYEKDILRLHNFCDELFFGEKMVENRVIDEYITLVKILLAYLHDYRSTKAEWTEFVNNIRKSL